MAWHRGTEAPMDTTPAGPRKRSIFETQDTSFTTDASGVHINNQSSLPPSNFSNAGFLFHCRPDLHQPGDTLADVEMTSVTPPHHSTNNTHAAASSSSAWVDQDADTQHDPSLSKRPISAAAVNRIRRKRNVQSKASSGSTRRRQGQIVLASRSARGYYRAAASDDDHEERDDDDDDDHDDDDEDDGGTPGRMRSITKYAVNYFMPGSGHDMAALHAGGAKHAPAAGVPPVSGSGLNHLDWPELLLGYAQFLFNASILAAFLYLLFCVVRTVQQDVAEKVRGYEMDTLSEITSCAAAYSANRCGTDMQAPALASACLNWQRCSARDPAVVGRARVTAETFAEILNGFVDVVSWKSMLFSLVALSILVGATNSVFSFFRFRSRRQHQQQRQRQQQQQQKGQGGQQQGQQQHQHQAHQQLDENGGGGAGHAPYGYMGHPHAAAYYHAPPPWTMPSAPATPARKRLNRSQAAVVDE